MKTRTLFAALAIAIGLLLGPDTLAEETNAPPAKAATAKGEMMIDLTKGKEIPPEVIEKLDADQLYKLMELKMDKSADIPLIAPVIVAIVFGFPVAIVAVVLWFRYRRNRQLHQTLSMMIEKGVPIPPELLAPEERRRPSDLRRGIILIAVGLGIVGFLLTCREEEWGLGLIPLLIGVGYLIVWKLDQRKQAA